MVVISIAAGKLWAAHKLNSEELPGLFADRPHVECKDVKEVLRQRGLLVDERQAPPKVKGGTRQTAPRARAAPKVANGGGQSAASAMNDPLFLDGNTIKVTWKRQRELIGKVTFLAAASRPRANGKRGLTKYRIFFDGRDSEGALTSWSFKEF